MSNDLPTTNRPTLPADSAATRAGAATGPPPVSDEERNGVPPRVISRAEFKVKNERRLELVDKEIDGTLTPAEEDELRRLEAEVDAYARANFPNRFEILERAEERARRLGYDR